MASATNFDPSSYRILVIDDDVSLFNTLMQCLEDEGYAVTGAETGEAGLSAFQQEHIDVVISDIMMPRCDGKELLVSLKKLNPNMPVLMMTGYSDFTEREALNLGATAYFKKPFGVEELYDKVELSLCGLGKAQ